MTNNILIKKNKIIRYSKKNNKNFNFVDAGVKLLNRTIFLLSSKNKIEKIK